MAIQGSILRRLVAGMLVLQVIWLFVLGIVLTQDASERLMHLRISQAEFQAATLGNGSMDGLVSDDYEILERMVASSLPSEEYAYAALVRPDGIVLTHTNLGMIAKQLNTPGDQNAMTHQRIYKNRPVLEAVHPVVLGRKHLANAHVAFYLDVDDGLLSKSLWKIIVILAVALVVIGISVFYLARRIVGPIEHLRTQVANTDLNKYIHIDKKVLAQKDEVGHLAKTFNDMSERLVSAYAELKKNNAELEDRIKKRTGDLERANTELTNSRSRTLAVMANIADAIVTITADGLIESFNYAAEQTFGYSAEEVIGRNVSMLMPEPESSEHDKYIQSYVWTGKKKIIGKGAREVEGQHKSGSTFPMELLVSEVKQGNDIIFIGAMRNITERKEMVDSLRYLANHDGLTGLYNRGFINQELDRIIARAKRESNEGCALLYIDLDNFKFVNDTQGHAAGDTVLLDVANIIKDRLRDTDIAARIGGDEFIVLLVDIKPDQVEQVAEVFRKKIEAYAFVSEDQSINVGCSIGVTVISKRDESSKDILAHADYACYKAKKAGRNVVRLFTDADYSKVEDKTADVSWLQRIKEAIDKEHLTLQFQPMMQVGNSRAYVFEVLLRMVDPETGELIMPGGFLPTADRFGLSKDIDAWVVNHSLTILSELQKEHPDLMFSVNITPQSIDSDELPILLKSFVDSGLKPESIILELTESMALHNYSVSLQRIKEIKARGFKTALDNFGTGFSTFLYLQELPIDFIKIDYCFINTLKGNSYNQAVVKAMIDIAHRMDIKVCAGYVEDEETLDWLRLHKIDFVQGNLIAKPMDKEGMCAMLSDNPDISQLKQKR